MAKSKDENVDYAAALDELEKILKELESDKVNVDRLAEQVKRASELIAVCREKINTAKLEVEKVVADLNAD
jgi:exodeoxyribonuclease VII small subunit